MDLAAQLAAFVFAFIDLAHVGYVGLGLLIGVEAAGIPLPGETALIAAAILSSRGELSIEIVIVVAAGAAIIGDNIGYLLGRHFGRGVLERPGFMHERRVAALDKGDEMFAKHGSKTVFFGRWVAGFRIFAAWLAGISHMPWHTFLGWNALGGILWATSIGLAVYFGGEAAQRIAEEVGVGAAIAAVAAVVIAIVVWHVRRRRRERAGAMDATP